MSDPPPGAVPGSPPAEIDLVDADVEAGVRTSRTRAANYRRLLAALPTGVVVVDAEGTVLFSNPTADEQLGIGTETLVGQPLGLPLVERGQTIELEIPTDSGSYRILEMEGVPVLWGDVDATMLCTNDVTKPSEEYDDLQRSHDRYALAMRGSHDGLWDWDLAEGTFHVNHRWRELIGLGSLPDDVHDPSFWFDRTHDADKTALLDALDAHLHGRSDLLVVEHRLRMYDGSYLWVLARGRAIFDDDGEPTRIAGSLTDISARRHLEERLRHEARHDPLTGLANRRLLIESIEAAQARARRSTSSYAVAVLDLDGFKEVNDQFGHEAGDHVLVEVARRLRHNSRPNDLAARLGGDEFAVLLDDVGDLDHVTTVAGRLHDAVSTPMAILGELHTFGASVGLAIVDREAAVNDVLRAADAAMYRAKEAGEPIVVQL